MAIPIQYDIEISQAYSRTQAIEARVDARYVADLAQNTSNMTLLAKFHRFGSRIHAKISKVHLRHYVAIAWVMSIVISLLSAMVAMGPLLWYTHAAARHGNDSLPSQWRTYTSFICRFAREYLPRTACSFEDLDRAVASAAGMVVFCFTLMML